jgi:hypothetical protein
MISSAFTLGKKWLKLVTVQNLLQYSPAALTNEKKPQNNNYGVDTEEKKISWMPHLTFKLFEAGLLQPPPARNIQVKNMEQIGILRDSKKKKKKN